MVKHKTKTLSAALAIVKCLKRENMTHVFCVPGESYLPVLDALYDEPTIEVISARHESGAAFMAEGYAKATLKPGVVLATRGVGAANLAIGVHTAYQDSTPMLVLLGQVHSQFRGREGFQEVDLEQFFQPITKWAVEIKDAKRLPEIVERALRIAQSGRPGPVVISLPEDILPVTAEMYFGPNPVYPKPVPGKAEVSRLEDMLQTAKRPLLIVGGGIKASRAEEMLIKFAEKYYLPVLVAFRRHDAFPNDHSLYVGHLGLNASKHIIDMLNEADVVIALGTRLSEVTTQDYSIIETRHRLIHIDIDYSTLGKVYRPHIGIVADARESLKAFMEMRVVPSWKSWVNEKNIAYRNTSELTLNRKDIINKQIIAVLAEKLPKDAIITNDAGNFAGWLHAFYPFKKKQTYVGPTSGAMGYGLPAALGVKLAKPNQLVVSLSGDGGFMMTVQELETAVRHRIPVISLVFNNEMYGTIRMHQEMHYPERVIGTDLGKVSFAQMARSVGAIGYTVRTRAAFIEALTTAMDSETPTVIEIMTEKEQISVGASISDIRKQNNH